MTRREPSFPKPSAVDLLDAELVIAYAEVGIPLDELAYTDQFEVIVKKMRTIGDKRSHRDLFRRLLMLRKSGRLPRLRFGIAS